jgi:hypothetical protein
MENRKDDKRRDASVEMMRHLTEAIEQVRLDMARVELWAHAVSAFARPVPGYDPAKMKVWLPHEQATELRKR